MIPLKLWFFIGKINIRISLNKKNVEKVMTFQYFYLSLRLQIIYYLSD